MAEFLQYLLYSILFFQTKSKYLLTPPKLTPKITFRCYSCSFNYCYYCLKIGYSDVVS